MTKLARVIAYFVTHFPRPLRRTELVKCIYCFEYWYMQMFGHAYSEARFARDNYGPMDWQIVDEVSAMPSIVVEDIYYGYYGTLSYEYRPAAPTARLEDFGLDEWARAIADFIIEKFTPMRFQDILSYTYSTPPMAAILQEEEELGTGLQRGRAINMQESRPLYRPSREALEAAKRRLVEQAPLGSDVEYYQHLATIHESFGDLRRRVRYCTQGNSQTDSH